MSAQDGTNNAYTPYSVFGLGDISKPGSAYNRGMGGVGIAGRSKRYINYLNPASITARDTLSFMLDFGLQQDNRLFRQGDLKSAHNTFNISNVAFTVPIYKSGTFIFGLTPFSDVAYDFSHSITDPALVGSAGNISYSSSGNGGIYQLFGGGAVTLFKRLSIGAQVVYYFGNIDKTTQMNFTSSSYRSISGGYTIELNGVAGNFGLQWEQPLSTDKTLSVGATYKTSADLKGYVTDYKFAQVSSVTDTLNYRVDTLRAGKGTKMAGEVGLGVSIRSGDRWSAEVDYTYSDWASSGLGTAAGFANRASTVFEPSVSQSFRAGFEFVPNRNDIRYYFRRCTYRGGAYMQQSYFKLDGQYVNTYGLTFGITLPVHRFYNGVTLGVDLGQRGFKGGNVTRERFATFVIGFNIHDLWFIKARYE